MTKPHWEARLKALEAKSHKASASQDIQRIAVAPIAYRTVLGAFGRLESAGFGDVVTIDQIVGVLNGAAPCPD